ncbi:alpha/beta fold hydrolase [Alkalihalobacillus hwajinpoensis]|uniref:alpha/beta fold hydrolase n=1 Tax=Guptibacillus hwajinpoensis TaxID=208199 RepID=UPI001884634A|nr:alpha/beta fold hydrolase [Pseudalkalibacillus hwajinpoensis]MBF0705992.1 alpha/beta fold hydrolase [Pseudalkalibacillus hwajinpoensis]
MTFKILHFYFLHLIKLKVGIDMSIVDGEYKIAINGINHWIKIDGANNNTIPLILVHGGPGGNHYSFERIVGPLLSKSRTIVYYEQRGCGRSDAPSSLSEYTIDYLVEDFKGLLKWLGTRKVDLLGYSFGGELALEFAYAFKDEINKVVLSAPSLLETDIQKMVQIAGILSVADETVYSIFKSFQDKGLTVDETYNKLWDVIDSRTVDLLLFENQEIAQLNRNLWEESKLINSGLMLEALTTNPSPSPLIHRLKEIPNQTLLITGIFDRNTGLSISKIIHSKLKCSQWELFNKSAHFPDLEETNKFVNSVINFLDT